MQPVIEVQCPFCNAHGQIMTPPAGAIIVGPCPRCNELVLLFSGAVLPLDKDVILHGSSDEKKGHITETIMEMVASRVEELVDKSDEHAAMEEVSMGELEDIDPLELEMEPSIGEETPPNPITDAEVRDFVDIDLHLIDRKVHFEEIFGTR